MKRASSFKKLVQTSKSFKQAFSLKASSLKRSQSTHANYTKDFQRTRYSEKFTLKNGHRDFNLRDPSQPNFKSSDNILLNTTKHPERQNSIRSSRSTCSIKSKTSIKNKSLSLKSNTAYRRQTRSFEILDRSVNHSQKKNESDQHPYPKIDEINSLKGDDPSEDFENFKDFLHKNRVSKITGIFSASFTRRQGWCS